MVIHVPLVDRHIRNDGWMVARHGRAWHTRGRVLVRAAFGKSGLHDQLLDAITGQLLIRVEQFSPVDYPITSQVDIQLSAEISFMSRIFSRR